MTTSKQIFLIGSLIIANVLSFAHSSFAFMEPGKRTFLVSAYYSPLPDQKSYAFGSYEADIYVNGKGIAGADGTPVYVGMIAAPKNYAFGTKILIPGLGVGTVHDRGGAIIASKDIDRLDVWMGYGDEGLKRALNWGMRTVEGEILSSDAVETLSIGGNVTVPVIQTKKEISKAPEVNSEERTLRLGDSGESVRNLQQFLYDRGFITTEPTGYFGEQTKAAVILFQEFYRIIPNADAAGAGIFGPKTRAQLEAVWDENYNLKALPVIPETIDLSFKEPLEKGAQGDEVKKLQRALQGLGYFSEVPNGVFGPATKNAVMSFQKDYKLIGDENSLGAGILGPKTEKKLSEVLKAKEIKIIAGKKQKTL